MQIRMIAEQMKEVSEKLEGIAWIGAAIGFIWVMRLAGEMWKRKKAYRRREKTAGKKRGNHLGILLGLGFTWALAQRMEIMAAECDVMALSASASASGKVWIESMEAAGQYCRESLTVKVRAMDTGAAIQQICLEMDGVIVMDEMPGENGESGQNWEKIVTLPTDGDGEIYLKARMLDTAGQEFQTEGRWICDQTAPGLSVLWEGEQKQGFFSGPGNVCLMVQEKHFRPELWKVVWVKSPQEASGLTWAQANGKYLCRLPFSEDGQYECYVTGKDPAGNILQTEEANGRKTLRWTVDKEAPQIVVNGVLDQGHYGGEVNLEISVTDVWLKEESCRYTLEGEKSGTIALETTGEDRKMCWHAGMEQDWDDVYHLTVSACDLAENTAETEITFTINRTGALYSVEGVENGEKLLKTPDIVITEKNLSETEECTIFCVWEGESALLKENEDYTVEEEQEGNYQVRRYHLNSELFVREGAYTVQILSKDRAGNSRSNLKNAEGSLPVTFSVGSISSDRVMKKTEKRNTSGKEKSEQKENMTKEPDYKILCLGLLFLGVIGVIRQKVKKCL